MRTDPDERGIDLTKPQYFSAISEWTKRGGYGVLAPDKPGVTMLLWEDAAIRGLAKAEKGDVWMYTRETPTEATGVYVTDATLKSGRKVVDSSPEAAPFLWTSGAELIEYRDAHKKVGEKEGARLQGSLYLPANYEKGKQYPLVVYIYERQTQSHFTYGRPTANGFSRQAYTSNGYAVLMPDITYFVNDPGMSAVWALVPAVQAAIATGVVDPKRVALHGHSWGGYQTAFTITQTNIFAAAIAGAPLTDMISMYSVIYKNTGGTNGAIFEASQGRFTTGPWDNWEAYSRNSPVYSREERQDAAHHPAQRSGRCRGLHAGHRVLQHAAPAGEVRRAARVSRREPWSRAAGEPAGLHGAHEGVLRSLPEGRAGARLARVRRPAPQDAGAHRSTAEGTS